MARNFNPEIMEAVKNFLDEDGWRYSIESDKGVFRFGVNLRGKLKNVQYLVGINERDYNVYAVSPLSADQDEPEQIAKMAEFVCRANYGLKDGNFELDCDDGELRYKCYMNCNGVIPTREMIGTSIRCPAAMFERYSKGIMQILFGDMSPADAIKLCEGNQERPAQHSSDGAAESSRLVDILRRLQSGHESTEGDRPDASDE